MKAAASSRPQESIAIDVSVRRDGVDAEWDAFVESAPGGHHVQSSLWAQVKRSVDWQSERVILRRDGHIVAGGQLLVRRLHRGAKLAFLPRGPIAAGADTTLARAALDAVERAAQTERLLYLKVQVPACQEALVPVLAARGYVASPMEAAPTATVRVDVTADADTIERRMRRNARRDLRQARGLGMQVRIGGAADLPGFHAIVRETGRRNGFQPYPECYYRAMWQAFGHRGQGVLLLADHDGELVAGSMLVALGDTAACKMAVATVRTGGPRAAQLIHFQGMVWAREHGYRYYDLDGIDPEVARTWAAGNHQAARGVGHFKLGLGGEIVTGPGAWDRSFHPLAAPLARHLAPRLQTSPKVAGRLLGRRWAS